VRVESIAQMKSDAASGKAHPMALKKELARGIVADFHSAEAAMKAADDWAKQFQKDEVPEDTEEVAVALAEIGGVVHQDGLAVANMARLLVKCGLAVSTTDATRKIKQGSVRVGEHVQTEPYISHPGPSPARLPLRVGKRPKIAVLSW